MTSSWRRPTVEIELDGDSTPSDMHSFSTRDTITGTAVIKPHHDVKFNQVDVHLLCNSKTYVDQATPGTIKPRVPSFKQLLKLAQPIEDAEYPSDRVLKAKQTYRFAFTFVIPDEAPISACTHAFRNDKLKHAHLQLPPTLGDKQNPHNDAAPDMAKVHWMIRASIISATPGNARPMVVQDKARRIRVIPATEEGPPVDIDGEENEYNLRHEKSMKRRFLRFEDTGRLAIETDQPRTLRLAPPQDPTDEAEVPSTTTSLIVRFDPSDEKSKPPELQSLLTKMRSTTYFSMRLRSQFPSRKELSLDGSLGAYSEEIDLSDRALRSNVTDQWQRHEAGTNPQRIQVKRSSTGSVSGTMAAVDVPAPTKRYREDLPFYTAHLTVPISLPRNRSFVPTFHNCLVSRVYSIKYTLSAYPTGTGNGRAKLPTPVSLTVPVQISSSTRATSGLEPGGGLGNCLPLPIESRSNSVGEDAFEPRSIAPPPAQYLGRASIGPSSLPPGYSSGTVMARTGVTSSEMASLQHEAPAYSAVR